MANEFKRMFPNASRSVVVANTDNPELFREGTYDQKTKADAVRPKLEPSGKSGALRARKGKDADSRHFLVRVTSIRRILLDEDNLCEKYVVDCCRYAGLLPSDRPGQTKIEVCQRKAGKEEDEATIVEIYELTP